MPTSTRSPAVLAATLFLLAATPAAAHGQPGPVEEGQRVRAISGTDTVSGPLLERNAGGLAIRDERWNTAIELRLAELDRLDVWACCGRVKGALLGALVGAGAAALAGGTLMVVPSGGGANIGAGLLIIVGMPAGALVGALVGGTVAAPRHWEPVPAWRPVPAPDSVPPPPPTPPRDRI